MKCRDCRREMPADSFLYGTIATAYCSNCQGEHMAEIKRQHIAWVRAGQPESAPRCVGCSSELPPGRPKFCSDACGKRYASRQRLTRRRFLILGRDNFRCAYCGKAALEDQVALHLDHIVPRELGGPDVASKLITACSDCNGSKGDSPLIAEQLERYLAEVRLRNEQRNIAPDRAVWAE